MISFDFRINKLRPKTGAAKDYFLFNRPVSENKFVEIQLSKMSYDSTLIRFSVDLTWTGSSHAGPNFDLTLFGLIFSIALRDRRHWHYEEGRWERDDEED